MHEHADRLDFAPPPQPAAVRAFVLAIIAHVLLLLALTWGVNWKRESENLATEAELWSSVPQEAAPRVVQAPPLPKPAPPPPPAPKVVAPPPPPAPVPAKQPDIALEREKKKQELAERKKEELEQKKLEEAREKKLAEKKKQEEAKRREIAEQKAAEEKKKKEELAKAKAKQEAAKLEAMRKENLERMMKGATGAPSSTGNAARASGPSASYAGRIAARIKPNIVFTDHVSGNPAAIVEIRVAPDGTIVGRKLLESSGVKSWDEAVLRAIDRTEVLPRDTDGTVVPQFPIRFRPRD